MPLNMSIPYLSHLASGRQNLVDLYFILFYPPRSLAHRRTSLLVYHSSDHSTATSQGPLRCLKIPHGVLTVVLLMKYG